MNNENELRRLEGFVAKLLKSFQELKDQHGRLQGELRDREATIADLRAQLAENDVERNVISNRVGSIIEQIEEWESALTEDGQGEYHEVGDPSRQGSLFITTGDEGGDNDLEEQADHEGYRE
ncbi:MAG: hypothetical protein ACK5PS_07215 [Desulfopila sp.]